MINGIIYSQENKRMSLFPFINLLNIKKKGITNHNLEIRYFIETIGNSLVKVVKRIHIKLNIKARVMGCLIKLLSNFQSKNNFKIKSNKTPAIKGSVGKDTPNPKLVSFNTTANGVKNTINQTNLSKAKK